MRNRLLVVRRFTHDPQRVLAAIYRLTFVAPERCFDFLFRITSELRIAAFANSNHGLRSLDNAELAFRHASSLPLVSL